MNNSYIITLESFTKTYKELEPLYRQHYQEMTDRLAGQGVVLSPYNPRLDVYKEYDATGFLLNFVVRHEGVAVGYSNIYITQDMHNQDLIAEEDTVYILPNHRKGIGKFLMKTILKELASRGVKHMDGTAMTDCRVVNLWKRMGFKELATRMRYNLQGI